MRTSNGPSATRWAFLCSIMILALGWALPWLAVQAAPAFQPAATTANATTTSLTITKPTGVVQNDLLIATISTRGNASVTAPTGWTLVQQQNNGTNQTLAVFYKVAVAADITAANYQFGVSVADSTAGAILRYTGADPRAPIDTFLFSNGTGTSPTAPDVTTTVPDTTVVRIAGINDNTLTNVPAASRVTLNYNGGNDVALGVSDANKTDTGATGTVAFTTSQRLSKN